MHKYVMILFLCVPFCAFPQDKLDFQKADSLSYQYYLKGDWKSLIDITKKAFAQNISSKFLLQRAGYAYFVTGDYYAAINKYEEALKFDGSDNLTLEYLYYSNLYAGSVNARYYAGMLSDEAVSRLHIKAVKPIESIDTELAVKTNKIQTRSEQLYYRFGLKTELGYRVSLYQAYSYFEETISSVLTQQPEYLAILSLTLSPVWHVKTSYHRLFTNYANVKYPGNYGYVGISGQLNRFNLEANASVLKSNMLTTNQLGLQASVVLPGRRNIYFTSALTEMIENNDYRTVFSQTAGLNLFKNLWAEGNITLGNLKNYSTYAGLYIYNSYDPSVFRTGGSLIYFLGKHLSIIGNFTFDQQQLTNATQKSYYYQYSYSGGLKWKL